MKSKTNDDVIGLLKWAGSKDRVSRQMLKWGLLGVPYDRYVEPFCGSCETFMHRKSVVPAVLSDRDPDLIHFLQQMQSDKGELAERIYKTPFAYEVWDNSRNLILTKEGSPIERAAAFFFMNNQGFTGRPRKAFCKSGVLHPNAGFATTYRNLTTQLHIHTKRLQSAEIINTPELFDYEDILDKYDSPTTLFYLDPPYLIGVRCRNNADLYKYEFAKEAEHRRLITKLYNLKGMIAISTYRSEFYAKLLSHWRPYDYETFVAMKAMRKQYTNPNDRKRRRVMEVVYVNPAMQCALAAKQYCGTL
jgi:DNA adenine methylase